LEKYHWPGNVRELENVIQRAVVVAKGDVILPGDLPPEISDPGSIASSPSQLAAGQAPVGESGGTELGSIARMLFRWARQDPKLKVIPAVERELIIHALSETKGNQVHAAKLLGITRATLRKRVEKFSITRELNIK
jgi:DNA-binding NtrC family response regulator